MKKLSLLLAGCLLLATASAQSKIQNVVVIFSDDQGYEDLSSFGSKKADTPNIDQLAKEGMKLTSFYVASSVCTPSRAALLTGRMPVRAGAQHVVFSSAAIYDGKGLPPQEITIAELLKQKNYATGLIGKWHLGHEKAYLPTAQGFDYFYGLPYSNDMSIASNMDIAEDIILNEGYTLEQLHDDANQIATEGMVAYKRLKRKVPLMRGNQVIEYPANQSTLTERYTKEAVSFIKENKQKPFFLYFAHTFPHLPIFTGEKFKGSSKGGAFYDAVQEIDWSVGEVMKALKEQGLDKNTLVIFTSDNGPNSKGSAKPLRGSKFTTYEGGLRVPGIIWAPTEIEPTVSDEIVSALDLFPTIANYAGIELPKDRIYDGVNISRFLRGEQKDSPRKEIFYYSANTSTLDGIRLGDWKFIYKGFNPSQQQKISGQELNEKLYNIKLDAPEKHNLINKHPEKVKALKQHMQSFDMALKHDVESQY
ncbi:sulfatase [Paraglaciecola sp. L3A3]|uniref:sulfatase family protein n=1 Tax=Paraglaciecola sp. L3A3 TaxID=2686358 RepID=UPI00131CF532|nr:sulfatase [Paraglaciecola sp. L3A3]